MAKQQAAAKAAKQTVEQTVETTSVKSAPVKKEPQKPTWEIKDRTYYLKDGSTPLTFRLASRHSRLRPLLYFDKELGYQKEIRYATNQASPFADEQKR